MRIMWTKQALSGFNNIQSKYFTVEETKEYKKELAIRINDKISLLGTAIKSNDPDWEGTYKLIVDNFIVYYSFSDDMQVSLPEYFKHSKQK